MIYNGQETVFHYLVGGFSEREEAKYFGLDLVLWILSG